MQQRFGIIWRGRKEVCQHLRKRPGQECVQVIHGYRDEDKGVLACKEKISNKQSQAVKNSGEVY